MLLIILFLYFPPKYVFILSHTYHDTTISQISKVYQVSDETFIEIVKNANTYSDCLRALGLTTNGGSSTDILKRRISELKCDISHFHNTNKGSSNAKYSLDEILIENSTYANLSRLKERLVKLVKSIYPGMDDINANRLLRHMEVTPTTDEGMCSYSVIANMIYEKYYGNSEAFLNDFGYEMSINSKLNSGELMTDMYAYCNKGVLVNDNIVSKTNEGQVSLSDRLVSSMWNKLFNTNLINNFFKSKNINLEVSEEVLFDYYNINGNTNSLSKNLFDGIISNIVKSLEQGKHVAIALSDFDIIVDGFEERINNNHVMSIASVLDNGLLEVDSWGKKCYIDLKNVTKSASQITISELSLNEK